MWAAFLIAGAIFALGSGASGDTYRPASGFPIRPNPQKAAVGPKGSAERGFTTSALLVFSRDGDKTHRRRYRSGECQGQSDRARQSGSRIPTSSRQLSISDDGTRGRVSRGATRQLKRMSSAQADRAAESSAPTANADLPDGLTALLTGPEGFAVDVAAVFKGADFTLLLTTVIVVAAAAASSPTAARGCGSFPLSVVGLADGVAGIAATPAWRPSIGHHAGCFGHGHPLSAGVWAPGTNYALLLIARYRDELAPSRRPARRHGAAPCAAAGPAIIASGSTVTLSLLTLLFSRTRGQPCLSASPAPQGIVVAMFFALVASACGPRALRARGLFWPYVPKFGTEGSTERGVWHRLGNGRLTASPIVVVIVGARRARSGLALAVPQIQIGLCADPALYERVPEAVARPGQSSLTHSRRVAAHRPSSSRTPTTPTRLPRAADVGGRASAQRDGRARPTATITQVERGSGCCGRDPGVLRCRSPALRTELAHESMWG